MITLYRGQRTLKMLFVCLNITVYYRYLWFIAGASSNGGHSNYLIFYYYFCSFAKLLAFTVKLYLPSPGPNGNFPRDDCTTSVLMNIALYNIYYKDSMTLACFMNNKLISLKETFEIKPFINFLILNRKRNVSII